MHLPHLCPVMGGSGVAREALELEAVAGTLKIVQETSQLVMVIGQFI